MVGGAWRPVHYIHRVNDIRMMLRHTVSGEVAIEVLSCSRVTGKEMGDWGPVSLEDLKKSGFLRATHSQIEEALRDLVEREYIQQWQVSALVVFLPTVKLLGKNIIMPGAWIDDLD